MMYYLLEYHQNLDGAYNTVIYTYDNEIDARADMYSKMAALITSGDYIGAFLQVVTPGGVPLYEIAWPEMIP